MKEQETLYRLVPWDEIKEKYLGKEGFNENCFLNSRGNTLGQSSYFCNISWLKKIDSE